MTEAIPDTVVTALRGPDWTWLRTAVRERLEADGKAASVTVDLDVLAPGERRVLIWLLGWPTTKAGRVRIRTVRLNTALRDKVTSGVGLPETLAAVCGPLDDRKARRSAERIEREASNQAVLTELLALTGALPELAREHAALSKVAPATVLRVPDGTASGTTSWSVYEASLRAACEWWRLTALGEPVAAKQLAGRALPDIGGTKATWTLQRRQAFSNLIGRPFDQAVTAADTELRLRGPLTWVVDSVIADAAACRPWLSLPARGVRRLGFTNCLARGVLIVENSEAFEQICVRTGVPTRWLVIWGSGYASDDLIVFLRHLDLPIAASGDLDADGIEIIANMAARLGRPVHAVGMSASLWRAGVKRAQTSAQLARARAKAAKLVTSAPRDMRELAAAIAVTGESCEQETLYDQVLSGLDRVLMGLEAHRAVGRAFE